MTFARAGVKAASLCALSLLVCAPRAVRANGRFPAASQLIVDRADARHLFVSATYGLLVSADAGEHWSLICEAAFGSKGTEDAAIAVMNHTLLAGVYAGLSVSPDPAGCGFAFASGPLANQTVIDVAIDQQIPDHAVAITSTAHSDEASFTFENLLAESLDNGKSFQRVGEPLPDDLEVLTVDTAPSQPARVYVSGISVASSQSGLIERSDDRGAHWTRISISDSPPSSLPFIAAVDPNDADTLYMRVTRGPESLIVSHDAGQTWRTVFTGASPLAGFALSPDGSQVAVGTNAGIALASTSDFDFHDVSAIIPTCLTWTSAGLYVCAKESTTGFSIGLSLDEGAHFRPLYHLSSFCGPACAQGTPTAERCPAVTARCDAGAAGAPSAEAGAGAPPSDDAGNPPNPAAGKGGSTSSPSMDPNHAGAGGGAHTGQITPVAGKSPGSGCACASTGAGVGRSVSAGLAALVWAGFLGRRRARRNS